MSMRVAVVGAGSWGTTVAAPPAGTAPTVLWARRPELATEIATRHTNEQYLPSLALPEELGATSSLPEAITDGEVVVMGVPSHGFRAAVADVAAHVAPGVPVVSLTKGLEQGTRLRMSQVIAEELPGHPVGVLSGPNLAKEILAGHAAATVVAVADEALATELQGVFATGGFRVYTNPDVVGCELGGALKNVMAIASGMADGLGTGDNTRAAVITRGLAELTRRGVALGGDPITCSGLAGMGDLVATCISTQSRNRHVGEELGKGRSVDEVIAEMNTVAEGVKSCRAVLVLARTHGVDMPIAEQVVAVCHEGRTAADAYAGLLTRTQKREMHGLT